MITKRIKQLTEGKKNYQQQSKNLIQQFDLILTKETLLIKTQTEFQNLNEKKETLKRKKEQLQKLVIENNLLVRALEDLKPESLDYLSKSIIEKQEVLQQLVKKQEYQKNLSALLNQIVENEERLEGLIREKEELSQKLTTHPDLTELIKENKNKLENLLCQEKELLAEKTKLNIQNQNLRTQISEIGTEVNELSNCQKYLTRITEVNHWINEFMIKLTYTIEKQVMIKIHHLFNNIFQDWFSILMEDENFSARLDESFTPIIEQNGYEINFNNLSGGERTAASLSYRLALNKVINEVVYEIKTKDLLILDEPTDGFSSEQLDKVRDVLEKLNLRQTLVVSHENKIESFVENVIRISKTEGVSAII